jgi:uncharacterized membrane protein YhaH (DUF805 family)
MSGSSANYFKRFYFSFQGRTGRQAYWLFMCLPASLIGFLLGIIESRVHFPDRGALVFGVPLILFLAWSGAAVAVKRFHDIGVSGWWTLFCCIPILNFMLTIVLGLIQGQTGPNEYGEDPRGRVAAL